MQISFFDGDKPFKFTKPIRLITLFSGYDNGDIRANDGH